MKSKPLRQIKDYGFDPDEVAITPDNYLSSALHKVLLQPSGQWDDFLPAYEAQAKLYETWGCTVYGGENHIQFQHKRLYKEEPDYDERFNYVLAGVGVNGASPHTSYESFRKDGLIKQRPLPNTYKEFSNKSSITQEMIDEGQDWKEEYDFKHAWIRTPTKEEIIVELSYSTVGIGVTAWYEDENGLFIDNGQKNTHWCICYGYIKDERGIILKVFDTYDRSKKLLHPDHHISVAKVITLTKKPKNVTLKDDLRKDRLRFLDLIRIFSFWKTT
jgi:hypothetical protein